MNNITEISMNLYYITIIASFAILWYNQNILRAAIVAGYAVFAILYINDIAYHAAVGYIGWTLINLGLFYEIMKADKRNV